MKITSFYNCIKYYLSILFSKPPDPPDPPDPSDYPDSSNCFN